MSGSHDSHAHDEHVGEAHPHPPIPTVTDEAADTPLWVPAAGLTLFLVLALFVAVRSAMAPQVEETVAADDAAADEAPAGEAAEAPAPAAAH